MLHPMSIIMYCYCTNRGNRYTRLHSNGDLLRDYCHSKGGCVLLSCVWGDIQTFTYQVTICLDPNHQAIEQYNKQHSQPEIT